MMRMLEMPPPCCGLAVQTITRCLLLVQLAVSAVRGGMQYETEDNKMFMAVEATVTYPPSENLTCHQCYYSLTDESGGENCRQVINPRAFHVQKCTASQKYCQVKKLVTNGEMTTFSRECAEDCTTGCETRGRAYTMQYCYQCCEYEMCNVMDVPGSASSLSVLTTLSVTWTLLVALYQLNS